MNENRLMDLILWGVMVLGGALLGLVYITTSYHDGGKNLSVAGSPTRAEMPRAREEGLRGPLKANAPPQAATAAAIPKERTSPPTPAPSSRPQEALSESKSEGDGAVKVCGRRQCITQGSHGAPRQKSPVY